MALSLYLQAGAAKKPAFWLDKFNISCQESEMLKSRRASPHGFGRNKNKKKTNMFWLTGILQRCRAGTSRCYRITQGECDLEEKCIIMTHPAQCNFSVAKNQFWMYGLD